MTLPEALKTLRRERGWTQRKLAAELRKTETTVQRWELGLRTPSPEICEKLAALATGAAASYFLQKAGVSAGSAHGEIPRTILTDGAAAEAPLAGGRQRPLPIPANKATTDVDTLKLLRAAIQAIIESGPATSKRRVADALERLAGDFSGRTGNKERSAAPRKGVDTAAEDRHSDKLGGEAQREEGKVRIALSLQIAPEHEQYYRMLERILASHEKGAIESIISSLDTLVRLAKITDKRLAEEERLLRQTRRRA